MNKLIDKSEINKYIKDGDTLLVGGFGLSGTPFTLIDELAILGKKELTVVSSSSVKRIKDLEYFCTRGV